MSKISPTPPPPPPPPPPHVALLPSPGMGHLIPIIELAKNFVANHHIIVTVIITSISKTPRKAETEILKSLPPTIHHVYLPPPCFDDLPKDSEIEITIFLAVTRSLSPLHDTFRTLMSSETPLVALVADPFATDAFSVAKEFGIATYLFFASNAMAFSFSIMLPKLDEAVSCEFRDLPEPVKIPGCVPVHGRDLLDPVQDRTSNVYKLILQHSKRFSSADGSLINTFKELEPGAIDALETNKVPVYPIGPLIRTDAIDGSDPEEDPFGCLKWLDHQPSGSVLFVSFGSGGTLSSAQIIELALGLEMSGQKFLWVVRAPNDKFSNGAYFGVHDQNDPLSFLPKGFLERTQGQGLVVPSWAPQIKVLAHSSTGGFLTHCGWNSILESVVHGVSLIAWPLYAEQKMNAVMLTEGLNIALRPAVGENGIIEREKIRMVVQSLIEGEEGKKIRVRMEELKNAARKAHEKDGSSTSSLSELVNRLNNQMGT